MSSVLKAADTTRHPNIVPAALALVPITAPTAQPWASRALCAQTDPDLFFSDTASEIAQAKAVCVRCTALKECRSYALDTRQEFGVWGGIDRDERRWFLSRTPHTPGVPHDGQRGCPEYGPVAAGVCDEPQRQ
jgi:hypothetical protein